MYPHKGTFPTMGGGPPTALNNLAMVGEAQWMSQSAYQNAQQNIDLDKVDWAQLAQQWIHMKESSGEPQIQMEAPPPPRFSQPIPEYEEKGEADMEMDDEPVTAATVTAVTAPPAPTNIFQTSNWNSESANSNSNSSSNSNSRGQHQQQQQQQQHQKPWNRSKTSFN